MEHAQYKLPQENPFVLPKPYLTEMYTEHAHRLSTEQSTEFLHKKICFYVRISHETVQLEQIYHMRQFNWKESQTLTVPKVKLTGMILNLLKFPYQLSSSKPPSLRNFSLSNKNCNGSSGHMIASPVSKA